MGYNPTGKFVKYPSRMRIVEELGAFAAGSPTNDDQMLAVNDALDKLAIEHKTEAELVKPRKCSAFLRAPPSIIGPRPCLALSRNSLNNFLPHVFT